MAVGGGEKKVLGTRYTISGYKRTEAEQKEADGGIANVVNIRARDDPDTMEALAGTLISEGHRLIAQGNALRELAVKLRDARK